MDTKGKMMINCQESTYLISKKQQDKLLLFERFQLAFHVMMCKYCRRFASQVNWMSKSIQRMNKKMEQQSVIITLTPEQKKRMEAALKNQTR